ncbi:4'-phosphopantetheinyl transferase family protein [Microbacterium murale]|uniref:4'-phosphopantetheinyl transferase n=1 Tax=Microbacterium murale TaxID=1081040 RepID=A0ABU0P5G3_9MICO|nr:hypothetical protein [Microbacterium murale]MDQ0642575.1 4'-phosphopantetheinyl transferase [Microbacterium murale]
MIDSFSLGPVRIAWATIDPPAFAVQETLRQIGDSQLLRHQGLDEPSAKRFAAGRLLLAELIPELISADGVRLTSVCDQCGGDHGCPRIEGAPFTVSLSYAGDMVVAAAVALESASAVGIDIEPRASNDDAPLHELTRLFAPRSPPGLREWTEIEAAVKADGRGLRIPPSAVRFGEHSAMLLPGGRRVLVPDRRDRFEVAAVPGPPAHIVSVAVVAAVNEATQGAPSRPARRGRARRAQIR